jgi:hypothetical protein
VGVGRVVGLGQAIARIVGESGYGAVGVIHLCPAVDCVVGESGRLVVAVGGADQIPVAVVLSRCDRCSYVPYGLPELVEDYSSRHE